MDNNKGTEDGKKRNRYTALLTNDDTTHKIHRSTQNRWKKRMQSGNKQFI
jgi:hypothetical protein